MIPLSPGQRVHLIGIAGTGMGALAGLLQEAGFRVSGSDEEIYPPISTLLAELRIPVLPGYRASNLEPGGPNPAPDLVVIGNAISRGNPELEAVLDAKLPYASLPETLRELFLRGRETVVVAGTHGKTTVSSILAWIFHSAGLDPGFLIGGLPSNFPRSFAHGSGEHFIVEGDEYDTAFFDKGPKFLHYRPDALVLTSVEFDHADIYPDLAAVQTAFKRLVNLIPRRGIILAWAGSETVRECCSRAFCPVETFGFEKGDWQAKNLRCQGETTIFAVQVRGEPLGLLTTSLSGEHNVSNVLAAAAMVSHYGISWDQIQEAVRTFRGVRRRMEIVGEAGGVIVVDDFAHHPTAIRETLRAARARFAGQRLWVLLEPRSNTLRRNILERELIEALAHADRVVIAEVYRKDRVPAAERLEPARVVASLRDTGMPADLGGDADSIAEFLLPQLQPGDVVLAMSNGAFGGIHQKLLAGLTWRAAGNPVSPGFSVPQRQP
ncbi:MAG: UDP-N-acetylmuramate:L-alanyl-gamma-D-glutamyl-meso-diaminopimelate ligase [Acidobacteria bacterium]|nr:UDP-N-acetylmuramate:L-alanyl-gamma-D-glutamyl-meso-diaminopimelate ligase [Acidobacteriota bacterium]